MPEAAEKAKTAVVGRRTASAGRRTVDQPKGKLGGFLKKKSIDGIPNYVFVAVIGGVGVYLLYRWYTGSGTTQDQLPYTDSGGTTGGSGGGTPAGSSADQTGATSSRACPKGQHQNASGVCVDNAGKQGKDNQPKGRQCQQGYHMNAAGVCAKNTGSGGGGQGSGTCANDSNCPPGMRCQNGKCVTSTGKHTCSKGYHLNQAGVCVENKGKNDGSSNDKGSKNQPSTTRPLVPTTRGTRSPTRYGAPTFSNQMSQSRGTHGRGA